MNDYSMVRGYSIGQEACLAWSNNGGKGRIDLVNNDFGDQFISGIAEANKSVNFHSDCIFELRD